MAFFHPKTVFDKAFEVGILLKALDGTIETLGGVFFLFLKPGTVAHWTQRLTAPELSHDPHDFVANHLLHWANGFTKASATFAALYLLSHGLVKVVLVFEILRNHLWAYIGLIVVTGAFIIYQLYHIVAIRPTFSFIGLTLFDIVIIFLTWREYGKQRQLQHERLQADSAGED